MCARSLKPLHVANGRGFVEVEMQGHQGLVSSRLFYNKSTSMTSLAAGGSHVQDRICATET